MRPRTTAAKTLARNIARQLGEFPVRTGHPNLPCTCHAIGIASVYRACQQGSSPR